MISFSIFLYLLDIMGFNFFDAAINDKKVLNIPRFKGIFLEPSHLAITIAPFCINLLRNSFFRARSILYHFYLLLAQSYFGYVFYSVLRLKVWALVLAGLFSFILLFQNFDPILFFSNSGLVRVFPLFFVLTSRVELLSVLGKGIGYGAKYFEDIGYKEFGVKEYSGFAIDIFLDLGLIGIILFFLTLVKTGQLPIKTLFIFAVLSFNFGHLVPLFPFLLTYSYASLENLKS